METTTSSDNTHERPNGHRLSQKFYHRIDETKDDAPETLIADLSLTKHGSVRRQQRGFKTGDINMIVQCGTMIGDDQVFLSSKDVDREIRFLKRKIKKIDRLRNRIVVISGNSVVTCYPCKSPKIKGLKRRRRHKNYH